MTQSRRSKGSILIELFFDATLLLLFVIQAFVAGCLLAYGHIPIPKDWANAKLAEQKAHGLHLQAEAYRLKLNGELELAGLKIHSEQIRHPLLEADGAIIQCDFLKDGAFKFNVESLVLSNGTLYLPAVYAPDGRRTPILERIAFHLEPTETLLSVDSFAAMHEDIRLRGAIEWPLKPRPKSDEEVLDPLGRVYQIIAKTLKEKARFSPFKNPTLSFDLSILEDQSVRILTQLSCREFEHAEASGSHFKATADIRFKDNTLIAESPFRLQVGAITVPRFDISAQSLDSHVAKEDWKNLLNGIWPEFKIAARSLTAHGIELEAPELIVRPEHFPLVGFSGSTNGFKGAVSFAGEIDTLQKKGTLRAKGSVDLIPLIPEAALEKMPRLAFGSAPHYDLTFRLSEGFGLESAHFDFTTSDLQLEDITLDHIRAQGDYSKGVLSLDEVSVKRDKQWLDLKFSLDTNNSDYDITLIGSAVPYEYNAVLPRWWSAIFKDFQFEENYANLGDFVIQGNAKDHTDDSFFGSAKVSNIRYKDAPLDHATLIVRGRGRHTELQDMDVISGRGWAKGNISFTSIRDAVRAPVSIRYDFKSRLPPRAAQQIFGGNVANLINDFQVDELPLVELRGVTFNEAYPQYAGRSTFHLTAESPGKISFKNVPLDHLRFTLTRHEAITYLRNVEFGYADGTGTAMIDILTPPDRQHELLFKLNLDDADQTQAIRDFPQFERVQGELENYESTAISRTGREEGRLNVNLHARGPIDNPYQFNGYGNFTIADKKLGAIQLLGPLSSLLKNTRLNFTSLNLHGMIGTFRIAEDTLQFDELRIDGPQTRISADGSLTTRDQALDMRVRVNLFANVGDPDSPFKKVGDLLTNPLSNLLEFQLTGTVQKQKWRSAYDPRNLLPGF